LISIKEIESWMQIDALRASGIRRGGWRQISPNCPSY